MFAKSIEGHSHLGKTDNSTSSLKVNLKLTMSAHPRIRICIRRTDTSQEKLGLDPKTRKLFVLLTFGFCFLMAPGMLGSVPYTTEVKAQSFKTTACAVRSEVWSQMSTETLCWKETTSVLSSAGKSQCWREGSSCVDICC